jgi:CBS domain containing-hemolysin-like protein
MHHQARMKMIPLPSNRAVPTRIGLLVASLAALLAAMPAHASFMQGETLAKAANVLAIVVIVIVPIIGITVFWLVHILPEKIAHKRHHPQTEAIQVLCLLSLVFGGLLWPLAWLWAYSKPVMYKLAYGRDKSDDYYAGPAAQDVGQALVSRDDVVRLRSELEKLVARGGAPVELSEIRDKLAALEPQLAARTEEAR